MRLGYGTNGFANHRLPDALALSARLQQRDPPVHLSERHTARGVLTLDPQVLLPEHDALLTAALLTARRVPRDIGATMLRLHAPEAVRI